VNKKSVFVYTALLTLGCSGLTLTQTAAGFSPFNMMNPGKWFGGKNRDRGYYDDDYYYDRGGRGYGYGRGYGPGYGGYGPGYGYGGYGPGYGYGGYGPGYGYGGYGPGYGYGAPGYGAAGSTPAPAPLPQ